MNKLALLLLGILLVAGSVALVKRQEPASPTPALPQPTLPITKTTDFTARFAIYTNGTFRVFTAAMYHNRSQDVFIEASNPNVVRVKKENVTWNDFFSTLPFKLTKDCLTTGTGQIFCTGKEGTLKFFLNGVNETAALDKNIQPGDHLLVSFGPASDPDIPAQLEKVRSAQPKRSGVDDTLPY